MRLCRRKGRTLTGISSPMIALRSFYHDVDQFAGDTDLLDHCFACYGRCDGLIGLGGGNASWLLQSAGMTTRAFTLPFTCTAISTLASLHFASS